MWQDMSNPLLYQHMEQRRADILREREQDRLAEAAIKANRSLKVRSRTGVQLKASAWLHNRFRRISGSDHREIIPANLDIDWTPQG